MARSIRWQMFVMPSLHERGSAFGLSAISFAMERFAADRSLALRVGEVARAAFLPQFTFARFQAQVGRLYEEALET